MEKSKQKNKAWEKTIGELLSGMEDEYIRALGGMEPVAKYWDYIIGDEMKDHVSLESIDEYSMTVRCDHPAYSTFFKLHEREVLARLKERFPTFNVRKVRLVN